MKPETFEKLDALREDDEAREATGDLDTDAHAKMRAYLDTLTAPVWPADLPRLMGLSPDRILAVLRNTGFTHRWLR